MTRTRFDAVGRVCTECFTYKEWDFYYVNSDAPHGKDPKCKECSKPRSMIANREYRKNLKRLVFDGYGGKCCCCDESELAFLTIDHVNNNGAEHRRGSKYAKANRLYRWLRDNNYPEDFQILCANCNQAKQIAGICPHQVEEVK